MPYYRFYTGNRITAPAAIEFASDQEAISNAKQLRDGSNVVEVWQAWRVVTRLSPSAHLQDQPQAI
jgi:hypothetical protein